ncbi:MAG: isopentenyl phosphate kinase family protein [Candidatus Methanomethylicus sp.]|nr:isopentenyl phosphate kinase family protein [Candidatus Methanomethylicus sp.]
MRLAPVDFVIKFGGSAITHKELPLTPNLEVIRRMALELSEGIKPGKRLVLIHGGGSFGHYEALKYLKDNQISDPLGIAAVRGSMLALTKIITDSFLATGLPVFAITPSSCIILEDGKFNCAKFFLEPVERCLDGGLIPMLGGDVVFDRSGSTRILSGDTLAQQLALNLDAGMLAFGTDVDGIMINGQLVHKVALEEIAKYSKMIGSRAGDVTGGMAGKVREIGNYLSKGGKHALIFNATKPLLLKKLLLGEKVEGTYIG